MPTGHEQRAFPLSLTHLAPAPHGLGSHGSKNIKNIKIVVCEYKEFYKKFENCTIYYKEHPLNNYYNGKCDKRDWLFTNQNYYPSFFKFWNASKKELNI